MADRVSMWDLSQLLVPMLAWHGHNGMVG